MKCPGQDSRFWGKEAIFDARCPECGAMVEFFKDEPSRKCPKCGHKFVNPRMDFGCAAYCKYADQCLGELPPELLAQREHLLKDRVAIEAKKHYGRNFFAINQAIRTAKFAEELLRIEPGDPAVVLMASHLHLVPSDPTERDKKPTPEESAEVAARILKNLSARDELVNEVYELIRNRESNNELSGNHKIFHDALLLARLEATLKKDPGASYNENAFLTESAKNLARNLKETYGG